MNEEKSNPVIVVTGAGQGIGKAISLYFAERGYDVAALDKNLENALATAKEAEELGTKALALECDVTNRDQVKDVYKKIDVQVNNAAIFIRERIEDFTDKNCDALIDVNLKGVLNTSREAIKIMKRNENGGSIINAHSILGQFPDFGLGIYGATKAGVRLLTRVLAAECAPYGIRVNGYAPSVTDTPMVHHIIEERPDAKLDQIPMREFGTPEQIAKLCWFFASDLSEYTTGVNVPCDGGTWDVQRPFMAWNEVKKEREESK